jgi:hypothetical protein
MANYKNTEKLLNDAISNISDDRECASKLLSDVMVILSSNNDSDMHKKLGEVASKYLETLQRSNEQLVKLAALSGKLSGGRQGFSKDDIESIYKDVIDGKE